MGIATVDEEPLHKDIKNLMRKAVEETQSALIDDEVSKFVGAGSHEGTATARTVRNSFAEALAYTDFSPERWRRIRTSNGAKAD